MHKCGVIGLMQSVCGLFAQALAIAKEYYEITKRSDVGQAMITAVQEQLDMALIASKHKHVKRQLGHSGVVPPSPSPPIVFYALPSSFLFSPYYFPR